VPRKNKKAVNKRCILFSCWLLIIQRAKFNPKKRNVDMPYKLSIHHIDVGQGDATLIVLKKKGKPYQPFSGEGYNPEETIEKAILIDAGKTILRGRRVLSYCRRKLRGDVFEYSKERLGYKKLDMVIMSHFDQDHIGGLPVIINSELVDENTKIYSPQRDKSTNKRNVLTNKSGFEKVLKAILVKYGFSKTVEAKNYIRELEPNKMLAINPMFFYCIAANQNVINHDAVISDNARVTKPNQISLAFVIEMGKFIYYTGGDIGQAQEKVISEKLKQSRISALKLSHHGSITSTPNELVNLFGDPCVAVVPVGFNSHKHPDGDVIGKMLESSNVKKLYFTGQLDQYVISAREAYYESEEFKMFKVGNIVISTSGNGSFYVNYDSIDLFRNDDDDDENNIKKLPDNAFYEVILSFVQHRLMKGLYGRERDKARQASMKMSKKMVFNQSQYFSIFQLDDSFGFQCREDEIKELDNLCKKRYCKILRAHTLCSKNRLDDAEFRRNYPDGFNLKPHYNGKIMKFTDYYTEY
jgi:beta-lactamase superfamily II metal-dependent hydrolase